MCRFVAYLGEPIALDLLLFRPKNSLVNQSFDAKEFRLRVNGDGFGVAWYVGGREQPVRVRTVTPAWNNQNLRSLAPAMTSKCVLAHVRAASPGLPVVETNCHPFVHDCYAFCHNGSIGNFTRARRTLLRDLPDSVYDRIEGSTDSELAFAIFLHEMELTNESDPAVAMSSSLAATIRRIVAAAKGEPSYLNLCVTDGARLACTRYSNDPDGAMATLYFHQGRRYVCEGDTCRMVEPDDADTTAILASEPLSDDPGWEPVPPNHVGVVREDRTAEAWALDS
ncbi:MAG: class II glutamine amidotransferase [Planctomycetota bacterium]|jgi:ergothioneine biosynthesis protein EgtC